MNWLLVPPLILLLLLAYAAPMAMRVLAVRRLQATCTSTGTLVLTYDDGPSPTMTPNLVELLRKRGVKATFLMSGSKVEQHPELVELISAAGHEIGTHSYDHLNGFRNLPWSVLRDVARGYSSLERWVGRSAPFRPPHGKINLMTWMQVAARRAPLYWWTKDSGDTAEHPPASSATAESIRQSRGGVVLLHDLDRAPERNRLVLETTEELLDVAESEGLRVVPLRQLLESSN